MAGFYSILSFLFFLFLNPITIGIVLLVFFLKKKKPSFGDPSLEEGRLEAPKFLYLAIALILVGVNVFLYKSQTPFSIGASGFFVLLIISVLLALFSYIKRPTISVLLLTLISIISAVFLSFRANGFVQGMNLAVIGISIVVLIFVKSFESINPTGLWVLSAVPSWVATYFKNISTFFTKSRDASKSRVLSSFKTLTLSLLVFLVFATLLSNADPIFNKLISTFLSELTGRAFLSLVILILTVWGLTARINRDISKSANLSFISFNDMLVPGIVLACLFGFFIFIQAKYLFGGHDYVKAFDLTYSEYVRKGFIELLSVTFIGGLLTYFITLKNRIIEDKGKNTQITLVNAILLLELFLMLCSAYVRNNIYMETYGLTRVRLIGMVFLGWLAILLFLLFTLNGAKNFKEKYLFGGILFASVIVVASLNFVNIDEVIAYSVQPITEYSPKDYFYVNILSEDAVDGWKESVIFANVNFDLLYQKRELSDDEKKSLTDTKLSLKQLKRKRDDLVRLYGPKEEDSIPSWQAMNMSKKNAYNTIMANRSTFFDDLECLLDEIETYQLHNQIELEKYESNRLHTLKYPFVFLGYGVYPESLSSISSRYYFKTTGSFLNYDESRPIRTPAPKSCLL